MNIPDRAGGARWGLVTFDRLGVQGEDIDAARMRERTMLKVLETTVEEIDTAVRQAGFEPGRRLRVVVSDDDVGSADDWQIDLVHQRLNRLLGTTAPPPFDTMTEDEIIAMANEEIRAHRAEQRQRR